MKTLTLLLLAGLLAIGSASARDPKQKHTSSTKRAFSHTTESGKGKGSANKARFRHENRTPTINLHPHDPERFTKARTNGDYKYPKAGQVK